MCSAALKLKQKKRKHLLISEKQYLKKYIRFQTRQVNKTTISSRTSIKSLKKNSPLVSSGIYI
ncbi:hypothetical protein AT15_04680 [Kosmotoga arenicorallina S304]|uniref:Uncharacterized protein n=1 Tax=Kosmotoga arenicorallina S304 TaxID=1453497 RepID=A0A176JXG5_9BACT|nr:hypothetical protein AT15_04680 [Kosmotoga arenicorallina S304]